MITVAGKVEVRYPDTGEELLTVPAHGRVASAVTFSPDGGLLATGGWDRGVRVWNAITGQLSRQLPGHAAEVTALAFSPDGKLLVSAGWDRAVRFWDPFTG